jgi:hypothetical protein
MPDYEADFPDMMGPAYIFFGRSGGEFAFGCVTGAIHGAAKGAESVGHRPGEMLTGRKSWSFLYNCMMG